MLSRKHVAGTLLIVALLIAAVLLLKRGDSSDTLNTMNYTSGEMHTAAFAEEEFTFLVPTGFTVQEQDGPDFKTFYLVGGKGTFGIYAGSHPNIFHPDATFTPRLTGIYKIREALGEENGEYWGEQLKEGMFGPESSLILHVFYRTSDSEEKEKFGLVMESVMSKVK